MGNGVRLNTFAALSVAFFVALPAPESPVADAAREGDIETVRALLREFPPSSKAELVRDTNICFRPEADLKNSLIQVKNS